MIRVLHIDDAPNDHELIKEFLSRQDENIDIDWVISADEALDRIEKNEYDCFLSDFQMPGTDGLGLLKLIRQRDQDVPFIFLTGQGNEQFAEEAFNNGATDYYSKNTGFALYNRLANSIRRVVAGHKEMLQRMRFENALRAVLQVTSSDTGLDYFKSLLINLTEAVGMKYGFIAEKHDESLTTISFFADGEPLENMAYEISGTPCEEVLKQGICYYPEHVKERFSHDSFIKNQNVESFCGCRLDYRGGEAQGLMVLMHDKKLYDQDFVLSLVRIFATRASAEMERLHMLNSLKESEELYHTVFNTVEDCIVIHDPETLQVLDVNNAVLSFTGQTYEEALNAMPKDVSALEEDEALKQISDMMKRVAAGEEMAFPWPIKVKSGKLVDTEVHLKRVKMKGKTRVISVWRQAKQFEYS